MELEDGQGVFCLVALALRQRKTAEVLAGQRAAILVIDCWKTINSVSVVLAYIHVKIHFDIRTKSYKTSKALGEKAFKAKFWRANFWEKNQINGM